MTISPRQPGLAQSLTCFLPSVLASNSEPSMVQATGVRPLAEVDRVASPGFPPWLVFVPVHTRHV